MIKNTTAVPNQQNSNICAHSLPPTEEVGWLQHAADGCCLSQTDWEGDRRRRERGTGEGGGGQEKREEDRTKGGGQARGEGDRRKNGETEKEGGGQEKEEGRWRQGDDRKDELTCVCVCGWMCVWLHVCVCLRVQISNLPLKQLHR